MILDGLLTFTGTSNGASGGIASGAQTDLPTTGTTVASNIIDLGVNGLPPSISGGGGGGARDIGIGPKQLYLSIICLAAFTSGSSIAFELSGTTDNGSGAPATGSYTVMWTSPVFSAPAANQQLSNIDLPRIIAGQPLPRFLRLRFLQTNTANTTGTIEAQIVLDLVEQIVGTTGALSGYPAGINIAN